MSDNQFTPVPLPGDVIAPPVIEEVVEQIVLEGIQPEDSRPRGDDYIPEKVMYKKRIMELVVCNYPPISDIVPLFLRDLDNYSRAEISLEEIKINCPEYVIEDNNAQYADYIGPYNHIRQRLLDIYEKEFGDK